MFADFLIGTFAVFFVCLFFYKICKRGKNKGVCACCKGGLGCGVKGVCPPQTPEKEDCADSRMELR